MAARSGKPREPRRNEPRGVGTWKRARRRHLGSPHSTRNRLRLTKRRRAYAAAGRSDLVPSRTRPGANFRRLRARQSKGTSRLVGRDSRQSETLDRNGPAQRHQSSRSTHPPRRSCESRGSPPAGRCPRILGEHGLATPTRVRRARAERGRTRGHAKHPVDGVARNYRDRTSIWPSSFTTGQPGGAPVGGRDPQLKALSLT